ncbi:hypothetical protein NECAME_16138 [Necator americanus]|uniref:Uncharacterized protein n=1 Tax=Necator americanus TaxID=51031 RepID=W2TYQ8_NECAM|nr:hypothetical protein NECAME_16138 [Necator americanus]ETN86774.1 hypothetical protein NECAME_16138 [Necator americanus]
MPPKKAVTDSGKKVKLNKNEKPENNQMIDPAGSFGGGKVPENADAQIRDTKPRPKMMPPGEQQYMPHQQQVPQVAQCARGGAVVVAKWVQRALDMGVDALRGEYRSLAKYTSPDMTWEAFKANQEAGRNRQLLPVSRCTLPRPTSNSPEVAWSSNRLCPCKLRRDPGV